MKKRLIKFSIWLFIVLFTFPAAVLSLTIADLPTDGSSLVINHDDSLVIQAGQTGNLNGSLIVQGTGDEEPTLSIENNGTFIIQTATLEADQGTIVMVNAGTAEFGDLTMDASSSAYMSIDNTTNMQISNLSMTVHDSQEGLSVANTGTLTIGNCTVNVYGSNFLLDNQGNLVANNTFFKVQNDDVSADPPALTIQNLGTASFFTMSAIANGASGIFRWINQADFSVDNVTMDNNYGGTFQVFQIQGTALFESFFYDGSGAAYGELNQMDLVTVGGTFSITDSFFVHVAMGGLTFLNMADVNINAMDMEITDGGVVQIGSRDGSLNIQQPAAAINGEWSPDSRLSAMTIWHSDALTIGNPIAMECDEGDPWSVSEILSDTLYTFKSDCSSETDQPPYAASDPDPATGDDATGTASLSLYWTGGDPDGDAVTYDVYLIENSESPYLLSGGPIASGLADPTFTVDSLQAGTQYAWRVITHSGMAAGLPGPVWNFTTAEDDEPPTPSNNGGGGGCFITSVIPDF